MGNYIEKLFSLPQPQKREAIVKAIEGYFAIHPMDVDDLSFDMATAEERCTGSYPVLSMEKITQDEKLLYTFAYRFRSQISEALSDRPCR
jgi:hypothetical protein